MQSFLLQLLGLGSAYSFLKTVPLCVVLSLDTLLIYGLIISLWAYGFILVAPLLTGFQMTCVVLDVFSPLFVLVLIPSSVV